MNSFDDVLLQILSGLEFRVAFIKPSRIGEKQLICTYSSVDKNLRFEIYNLDSSLIIACPHTKDFVVSDLSSIPKSHQSMIDKTQRILCKNIKFTDNEDVSYARDFYSEYLQGKSQYREKPYYLTDNHIIIGFEDSSFFIRVSRLPYILNRFSVEVCITKGSMEFFPLLKDLVEEGQLQKKLSGLFTNPIGLPKPCNINQFMSELKNINHKPINPFLLMWELNSNLSTKNTKTKKIKI